MLSRQRKMRRRAKFGRGGFEGPCVLSRLLRRCCEVPATRGLVHAWISTRASMVLRNCHNFHDFRRLAKRRLPDPIFDYIDGAADEESTHRAQWAGNAAAGACFCAQTPTAFPSSPP